MSTVPQGILSDRIQELVRGRRPIAVVFLTYMFDPGFFELHVLPVFFDAGLSNADRLRLVQLGDAIRSCEVAVYYDVNGLVPTSAKLDVRRLPMRHPTGIFHPKNVFALVEEREPDADGHHARSVVIAAMSANLTQAGWWENVEVCHAEEIEEGGFTHMRRDVAQFLGNVRDAGKRAGADGHGQHEALELIRAFLLKETDQRRQRSTGGRLHTQFFPRRRERLVEFLKDATSGALREMNLEVISPYFDQASRSTPLEELLDEFRPKETRVYLPRTDDGAGLVSKELYEWVRVREGVSWAELPTDLLRRGKGDRVKVRCVHAKVYRFFDRRREILFVGSPNLTSAAHFEGGNVESGFLVETDTGKPDWWLHVDARRPARFEARHEEGDNATGRGTRLGLRFDWATSEAWALWHGKEPSPRLEVRDRAEEAFVVIQSLPPEDWRLLPDESAAALRERLRSTSIFTVVGDGPDPAWILVQEEGMARRESLLFELTAAEILKYWSLLTLEQRVAFLETRAPDRLLDGDTAALLTRMARLEEHDSLFERYAGVFHAFGSLEQHVRDALERGRARDAEYRLFGKTYDSLDTLLDRVSRDVASGKTEPVEGYVTLLCARQLLDELRRDHGDFLRAHPAEMREIEAKLAIAKSLRARIAEGQPADMTAFLSWFETWFVRRAAAIET